MFIKVHRPGIRGEEEGRGRLCEDYIKGPVITADLSIKSHRRRARLQDVGGGGGVRKWKCNRQREHRFDLPGGIYTNLCDWSQERDSKA